MSYLGSKAASGACEAIVAAMPPHDYEDLPLLARRGVS
jgi:hypothetical protein